MVVKVLHAAHLPFWSGGVVQQMIWEQQAANCLGLDWRSRVFIAQGSALPHAGHPAYDILVQHRRQSRLLDFRRAYYEWLIEAARGVDLLLLRYSAANPIQLMALKQLRCKVLLVHHTLEVIELAGTPGLAFRARSALERALGPYNLRAVHGSVAVTPEIAAYETSRAGTSCHQTFLYPNGISGARPIGQRTITSVPQLLFVASRFFPWHGLDRLIQAAQQNTDHFIVDIVGAVGPQDMAACADDRRFVLHGTRGADYIAELSRKAWIGITSLALDRNGMEQACTLKVREYLGAGLPVYSGHSDVFPEDFPFFVRGDGSFRSILQFAHRARSFNAETVAALSMPYIDKTEILRRLHNAFEQKFEIGRTK